MSTAHDREFMLRRMVTDLRTCYDAGQPVGIYDIQRAERELESYLNDQEREAGPGICRMSGPAAPLDPERGNIMSTIENPAAAGSGAPEVAAATHLAAVVGAVLDMLADALGAPEDLGGALRNTGAILAAASAHVDADFAAGELYDKVRLGDELMGVLGGPLSAYVLSYNEVVGGADEFDTMKLGGCINAYNHALHVHLHGEENAAIGRSDLEPLVDAEDYRPEGGAW